MANSALRPIVDQRRLSDAVYGELLQAIVDRRFRPAERLVLDDLAAQLNVSPTPVRDALARLMAEGLVQATGRRGYCVTQMSAEEMADLYDLRVMCESYAVEKGIGRLDAETLVPMESTAQDCARLARSGNPADRLLLAYQDREFHRLIVSLGHNPKLVDMFDRLRLHIHAARLGVTPTNPQDARSSYEAEHFQIVAALRQGDSEAAKATVRLHIEQARDRAIQALARPSVDGDS